MNAFMAEIHRTYQYDVIKDMSSKLPKLQESFTFSYENPEHLSNGTIYVYEKNKQAHFKMLTWTGRTVEDQNSMITYDAAARTQLEAKLRQKLEKLGYIPYLTAEQQALHLQFELIIGSLRLNIKHTVEEELRKVQPGRLRNNFFANMALGRAAISEEKISAIQALEEGIQKDIEFTAHQASQFIGEMLHFNFFNRLLEETYIELDIFLKRLEQQVIERTHLRYDFEKMQEYFEKIVFLQSHPALQYGDTLQKMFNAEIQVIVPSFYKDNISPLIELQKELYAAEVGKRNTEFQRLIAHRNTILTNLVTPRFRVLELQTVPWFDKLASLAFHATLFGMATIALHFSPQILALVAIQLSLPVLQVVIALAVLYEGYKLFQAIKSCLHTSSVFHTQQIHQAGIAPPMPNNS